ncbi:MAG: alanine racemase [Pseudomonadota bacterium]
MTRPARADIDLGAFAHNLAVAISLAGTAKIVAVIKADAYGHGIRAVGRHIAARADALGVACMEEALALREAGIGGRILAMEGPLSRDEIFSASQYGVTLNIAAEHQLRWLEEAKLEKPVSCWLKVDSGMHRLGFSLTGLASIAQRMRRCAACTGPDVICTHFASADDECDANTMLQAERFFAATEDQSLPLSLANSAAVLRYPQYRRDWIRPGYMLTGNTPLNADHDGRLKPAMTLRSGVIALRDVPAGEGVGYGFTWRAPRRSRIATVAIGYGDGFPRSAPDGTPVLVKNQRAKLAGRVSMDMITVDVTDVIGVAVGNPVVLWGKGLSVNEVARHAGTIGYELLTGVTSRVPRHYI